MTLIRLLVIAPCLFFCLFFNPILQAEKNRFVPFQWSNYETSLGDFNKGALKIPVKVRGYTKRLLLQLDTGCESSFVYGNRLTKIGVDIDSGVTEIQLTWYSKDDQIGVTNFPVYWKVEDLDYIDSSNTEDISIGTLGSNYFSNRILLIDFPKTQFAVYSDTSLIPEEINSKAGFVPATIKGNSFYISIVIGTDTLKSVLFDTGASGFGLFLPLDEWKIYTGYQGHEPEILKDSVPAWGKFISIWRAPSKTSLQFSKITINSPMINCRILPPERNDNLRLMGNELFFNDYMIIIDFKHERFGLLPSDTNITK